jgi:hypothetical protein
MVEKRYFMDGEVLATGAEMIPEPNYDEAIVFEEFFAASLCMPPHCALADVLLKF